MVFPILVAIHRKVFERSPRGILPTWSAHGYYSIAQRVRSIPSSLATETNSAFR
jgi:hypothetical protein